MATGIIYLDFRVTQTEVLTGGETTIWETYAYPSLFMGVSGSTVTARLLTAKDAGGTGAITARIRFGGTYGDPAFGSYQVADGTVLATYDIPSGGGPHSTSATFARPTTAGYLKVTMMKATGVAATLASGTLVLL